MAMSAKTPSSATWSRGSALACQARRARGRAGEMKHRGILHELATRELRIKSAAPLDVADRQRRDEPVAGEGGLAREVGLEGADEGGAFFVRAVGRLGKLDAKRHAIFG